ncbi:MAG: tetratricopeptide repeat protein [Actinomycetota bacterium]|nr:tetratricopeptide repeat protein [Actinomycetota bacterium]
MSPCATADSRRALVVSIGAGVAYATIPGDGGVIRGCYEKKTGILRVIDVDAGTAAANSQMTIPDGSAAELRLAVLPTTRKTGPHMPELPTGTVTFLFTDVEGSTKLLHELGAEAYAEKLAEHRRVVREACTARGGVEVDTQGDAFFVAFPTAPGALEAARAITEELASGPIALRIGLHTGTPIVTEEGYVGEDVHSAARVAASAHGGQVVLSQATRALLDERDVIVELGEHRLKDILEPIAILQLGDEQFPPLKTISNTNLPRPASSFVGRERELSELLARIEEGRRLITLTGPGGSGKTRLALEAATTLVPEYKAGVFWVGLGSLRDATLVTETIAQTLGAKDGLADHVGERELLLLLDNLEQVIEAAPELSALVASCPNLTLLVTSRELLRVHGEIEYPVPPLAEAEAVSLFCQRAQTEATEEIAELCRRLDNLPLAVELAAARAKALSPGQILGRLSQRLDLLKAGRDADPRQQTLRATIAWSYDLLSEEEQVLLRRLAIFSGGCTLEATEEVCDANLDMLQSLIEKSLLRFSNERYWMLETIREYAGERLQQSGEQDPAGRKHAKFFLEFAEREGPELRKFRQPELLGRIENERANLQAALAELVTSHHGESALRLLGSLWIFWFTRGYLLEGQRLSELALSAPPQGAPSPRVDALWGAAKFSLFLGDLDDAASRANELLALSERCDIQRGVAIATEILAMVALEKGDSQHARTLFAQSAQLARETHDSFLLGSVANNFGDLELREGNFKAAKELFDESLAVGQEQGDRLRILASLTNLGTARVELGELQPARSHFVESLEIAVELDYVEGAAYGLLGLALCERDLRRAAVLIGAADSIFEELDTSISDYEGGLRQRRLKSIYAEIGDAASAQSLLEGRGMPFKDAVGYALAYAD